MPLKFDNSRSELPPSRRLHTQRSVMQELEATQKRMEQRYKTMLPIEPIYKRKVNKNQQNKKNIGTNIINNNINAVSKFNNNSNNNNNNNNMHFNNNMNNSNASYRQQKNYNKNNNSNSLTNHNFNYIKSPSCNNINQQLRNGSRSRKNNYSNNINNNNYNSNNNNYNSSTVSKSVSLVPQNHRVYHGKLIIDRDMLTREQHLSILATPKKKLSPRRRKRDKQMKYGLR